VEEAIRADPNRTTLVACNNFIEELPSSIGKLKCLKRLVVYDNALQFLPEELGELLLLSYCNVRFNRLERLPPAIGKLTALRELHLESNCLSGLPSELGQVQALQKLDVRNNKLASLPLEIGNLCNLKELWASGNALETIPPQLGRCTLLQELWVEDNLIKALPPEFVSLVNLVKAGFQGNPMETPPIETCQDGVEAIMSHLKDLARGFYPYPKSSPGLVLIVANGTYGLAAARENAHAVAKVFTDHNFELFKGTVHLDKTVKQISSLCKELGKVDHTAYGGVVFYFTGLGDRNGNMRGVVEKAAGNMLGGGLPSIKPSALIPFFESLSCPSLDGKPKLFFLDICERTVEEGAEKVAKEEREVMPSDFLRAQATLPGTDLFVGGPNGMSWWSYFLTRALAEHGRTMDIIDLLKMVSVQLVQKIPELQELQMKPQHEIFLRMKLKFSDV